MALSFIRSFYNYFSSPPRESVNVNEESDKEESEECHQHKVAIDDFDILNKLGFGSYGKVYLVQKKNGKDNAQRYAMKILSKKNIRRNNTVASIVTEKNILTTVTNPFIVELIYLFHDRAKVFFILEYLPGGDFKRLLQRFVYLPEATASFYIKELILGLEYLHQKGIIYRDLKPSNIMLDCEGHVKIIDFGLCKDNVKGINYAICGTANFMAPEIRTREGYGKAVDWWSLGIVFYLMTVGQKPFKVLKKNLMTKKINYSNYALPRTLSQEAKSFIKGLLTVNQRERLGATGAEAIKQHQFFINVCWNRVYERLEEPPIKINLKNINFKPIPRTEILSDTSTSSSKSSYCEEKNIFYNFNYVKPSLKDDDKHLIGTNC